MNIKRSDHNFATLTVYIKWLVSKIYCIYLLIIQTLLLSITVMINTIQKDNNIGNILIVIRTCISFVVYSRVTVLEVFCSKLCLEPNLLHDGYITFTSVLGSERTIVMKASHSCHDHSKRSSLRLQNTKQSLARRLHCIHCIKENHLIPWYLLSVLINYYKIEMFF